MRRLHVITRLAAVPAAPRAWWVSQCPVIQHHLISAILGIQNWSPLLETSWRPPGDQEVQTESATYFKLHLHVASGGASSG